MKRCLALTILAIYIFLVGIAYASEDEGYDDAMLFMQVRNLMDYTTERALKFCLANKQLGSDWGSAATAIDTSRLDCGTYSGTAEIPSEMLHGRRFLVEMASSVPVAAIFVDQYGVKYNMRFDSSRGFALLISEDPGGNRFAYDLTSRSFIDVNFPALTITAKQVMLHNATGIEMSRNEIITALSEYYDFYLRFMWMLGYKKSIDFFITELVTKDEGRKAFLRYLLARKFYNFKKVETIFTPWILYFTIIDFYQLDKMNDSAFSVKFTNNENVASVTRDLQKKTETIVVGPARLSYRLDEKGVHIIETNFFSVGKVQEDTKKLDKKRNLTRQMVDYVAQTLKNGGLR